MIKSLKSFSRNDSGQSVVFAAIFMGLVAMGFLALAVDFGTLLRARRTAQSVADAASVAAAEELALGNTADEQSVANQVAKLNGFDTTLATHPASVVLSTPASGTFSGANYVEATASKPIHTIFLGAFKPSLANMSVSASAIAGGANTSPTCVCLTGTSTQDLLLNNGSKISAPACGVVENSNSSQAIAIYGGASLSALSLGTVSNDWDNSQNIYGGGSISSSTKVIQGITSSCTPTVPPAPAYSDCQQDPGGAGGSITVGPATPGGTVCYTSLTVGANNGKTTLNPGIYVISSGYLHFESGNGGKSNLGGDGVFFYLLQNGSLEIDNGANVNLVAGGSTKNGGGTAASTGIYNGILVYQPASNSNAISVAGGATAFMSGAIIAPTAQVTLNNGSGSTITGSIAGQTLTMAGGATLNAVSAGTSGSLVISSPKLVQ